MRPYVPLLILAIVFHAFPIQMWDFQGVNYCKLVDDMPWQIGHLPPQHMAEVMASKELKGMNFVEKITTLLLPPGGVRALRG